MYVAAGTGAYASTNFRIARVSVYLSAAGIKNIEAADQEYIARLVRLARVHYEVRFLTLLFVVSTLPAAVEKSQVRAFDPLRMFQAFKSSTLRDATRRGSSG